MDNFSDIRQVKDYWTTVQFSANAYEWENTWLGFLLEPARRAARLLEIGAGDGRMIMYLRKQGVQGEFHAIDITDHVRALRDQDVAVCFGDTRALPYRDDYFDVVFSLGVVEHFRETSQAIYEHARVTRPGGIVCITAPRLSLFTLKRLLSFYVVRRKFRQGSFEAIQGRNLRLGEVIRDFDQAGLDVTHCGATGIYTPRGYRRFPVRALDNFLGGYLYCIGRKV